MKPQLNTSSGTRQDTFKPSEKGEVSLSFQDELAATIHGAFEVALEIAVLEVTKLVGQALGDVRDQMHETLRENKSLKQRLQTAEEQLDAVRGSLDEGDGGQPLGQLLLIASKTTLRPQSHPPNINSHEVKTQSDHEDLKASLKVTVDATIGDLIVEAERGDGQEYFSEICVDGRVCSQDLPPTSEREALSQDDTIQDAKEELSGLSIDDETIPGSSDNSGQDMAFVDNGDPSTLQDQVQDPEVKRVRIKEEEREDRNGSGLGPSCSFDPVGQVNFTPDSLSLVQSKMLEEWRPDMLDLANSDPLGPGTSHALTLPPAPRPDAPELRIPLAGGLPAFAPQFSSLYQPGDAALQAPAPPPSQVYGVQVRTAPPPPPPPSIHVCKICGQAFQQPSELRRHFSLCQQRLHQQRSKQPPGSAPPSAVSTGGRARKLQLYPPGRSPFHCAVCSRDFNRMENLKTHLRIHTGERPYSCSVCAMPFRHSGALTRHFRIHTGEKPYVCAQCGKRFRNCGGLKFHQRSHSGTGQ